MSEAPVAIARRAWDAYIRGDSDAMLELFHPDVVWEDPERPGGGIYHGHEGALQAMREWMEGWAEYHAEPEEFIEAGEQVVVTFYQRARGGGSGMTVEQRIAQLAEVKDGKVTRVRIFTHASDALRAAGLRD